MNTGTDRRARGFVRRWWPLLAIVAVLGLTALAVIVVPHEGGVRRFVRLPGFLEDWRARARLREISELSQRTDADAIRRLLVMNSDRNDEVRWTATLALWGIKDPRAVGPLIAALKDTGADMRKWAAWGLGNIKDPRAIEPLIAALNDTDADVRGYAAMTLGVMKDPRALEPLIAALEDTDAGVRTGVALGLGNTKDPRAVEPLIAALNDRDEQVRENAAGALADITGVHYGQDPEKWQKWWEENKARYEKPEARNPNDELNTKRE